MKNYKLIMPLFLFGSVALTSCKVTRDPNKEFMDKALGYYTKLREQQGIKEGEDFKAWYFDPTSLKGALFDNEKTYKYIGILNVQNMTFSEVEKTHFIDIPNYNVKVDMDNMSFDMPPELSLDDPVKFIKEFPLVLIKNDKTFELDDVYSKFNVSDTEEVTLSTSARADNYSPNLFFINGFKYEIKNDGNTVANLDYSDCSLAILKRDVIELISEQMNGGSSEPEPAPSELKKEGETPSPMPFDIVKGFIKSYNKANKLPADTTKKISSTLNVPGYFGKDEKGNPYPVAVGPLAFDSLFKSQTVKDLDYVKFNEGVKKIAFSAFDSTNIKDVVFPTTLEQIDFSAFSNIKSLNSIYFKDTAKEVKTFLSNGTENEFEISQGEGKDPIKIKIAESFANSRISKVTFENYDNKSINNINMNGFDKIGGKDDIDCIEFVAKDGSSSYDSLSDALTKTNTINTAFQFEKEELTNANLTEIGADKTIYLAHKKGNGFGRLFKNLNEYHETAYADKENPIDLPDKPAITLKLESDLTLKGNIIVGGVTGRKLIDTKNYYKEGGVIGQYGAIDLNGHKLTVDGGFLDVNGKIIDSSTGKTGSLDVINNGVFKTNLVIKDSFSRKNYVTKFNNSDFPYHYYDFEDCEVPFHISNDSRFYVKETVTKNEIEVNVHTFLYAGKNPVEVAVDEVSAFDYQKELPETKTLPFIEFDKDKSTGELNVSKTGEKTNLTLKGNIKLNTLKLSAEALNAKENKKIVDQMFVPLTSRNLDVTIAKNADVVADIRIKLQNNSTLKVEEQGSLTINKPFLAYDKSLNTPESIDLPEFDEEQAKLIINGTLKTTSTDPVYFGGHIITNKVNELNDLVTNKFQIGIVVPEGGLENNQYKVGTFYKSYIYIDNETNENIYSRENEHYYTQTEGENVNVKNVDGTVITSKVGNGNWVIHNTDGTMIDTDVSTPNLTSYKKNIDGHDTQFFIDEATGKWNKITSDFNSIKHAYELGEGKWAINYLVGGSEELIQGTLNNIVGNIDYFESTSGLKEKYFYNGDAWEKVQLFEHNRIVCYLKDTATPSVNFDINKYSRITLIGNSGEGQESYETSKFNLNQTSHIITANGVTKGVSDNGIIDLNVANTSRFIYKDADEAKYIYASVAGKPDESYFKKITDTTFTDKKATATLGADTYGFTSNGSWQQGLVANNDNYKEFTFFQIAEEKDINRNFALLRKNADGVETFDVFTKASGIKINRSELEPGIGDLLPDDNDYIGFRYIILDGVKKVFVQHQPKNEGDPIVTELITIPNDIIFKEKSELVKTPGYKLTIFDAFELVSFVREVEGKKVNYYMDFEHTITIGSGGQEEINSGKYLALAIYTDKDIFKEVGGIPTPPIPGGGDLPGGGGIPEIPGGGTLPPIPGK